jgi:hypothetical protein
VLVVVMMVVDRKRSWKLESKRMDVNIVEIHSGKPILLTFPAANYARSYKTHIGQSIC